MPTLDGLRSSAFLRRPDAEPEEKVAHRPIPHCLKPDIGWRGWHGRKVPILLQKSAIRTTKRPTRCFEAHVAVCSIGSRL
jgi:hypothetical protein